MTPEDIQAVRIEIQKSLAPLQVQINAHGDSINNIQTVQQANQGIFAEITNLLNNSHPEWSVDSWTTLAIDPTTAGDGNLECFNWYRQASADVALAKTSANALKAPKTVEPADHSLWAANEGTDADIPRWDKVNGQVEIGGASELWDIILPMSNDIIYPGQRYYVQLETMLAAGTLPDGVQFFCGIWDNTAGQQKWIEGGTFTITGGIEGTHGSLAVDYRVVAFTDSGEQAISNVLSFTDAPNTFNGTNRPFINYAGIPGFYKFEIYRKIGSTYVKQYTVGNSTEGRYYDIGNPPQETVSGWPSVTETKPRAYAQTHTFSPGSSAGLGWVRHQLAIIVPTTYNRNVTTAGQQYFRFGLTGLAASARQVLIRKLGLSMGNGVWARSVDDVRNGAHSGPSTTAVGSGIADTIGIYDPPKFGTGGPVVPPLL